MLRLTTYRFDIVPLCARGSTFAALGAEAHMQIQRILVPVDYSACSHTSLRCAAYLAEKLQAVLDVVHVWDRPSYVSDVVLTRHEPLSGKSLITMIEENAKRDLEDFLKKAAVPAAGAGRLLTGDPATALLHELKPGNHQLVVVGSHGRTGLAHALLGSVAAKLVRLSPVPVLTVPDEAAKDLRR
jgi:nucleotide-binding universal stress UspA family protein